MNDNWIEPKELPGYRISRATIQLTDFGRKHGAHEPQLGRCECGELAYWVRPVGFRYSLRLRIEGLRGWFSGKSDKSEHRADGAQSPCLV